MTRYNLQLDIDNKDYYYHISKNTKNHLVQRKVKRPSDNKNDVMLLNDRFSYDTINNEIADNFEYEEDNLKREYLLNIINSKLQFLDERRRKIFKLRHFFNMTYNEIAKIYNLSPSRIQVLYKHSLYRLKIMCRKQVDKDL